MQPRNVSEKWILSINAIHSFIISPYLGRKEFHQHHEKQSNQSNVSQINDQNHKHQRYPIEITQIVDLSVVCEESKANAAQTDAQGGDQHKDATSDDIHKYCRCVDSHNLYDADYYGAGVDIQYRSRCLKYIRHIIDEAEYAAELIPQRKNHRCCKGLQGWLGN